MFNRGTGTDYEGTLTVEHMMLAAKSISSKEVADMKIYYKDSRGNWINPITNETIEIEASTIFQILWTNNTLSEDIIYGDVNGDGLINGKDVVIMGKYFSNQQVDESIVKLAGDVDLDGKITLLDLDILSFTTANHDYDQSTSAIIDLDKVFKLGDINKDSMVDYSDLKYLAELIEQKEFDKIIAAYSVRGRRADLNNDGSIDITDVIILHKHIAGIEGYETLPVDVATENLKYGDVNSDEEITEEDAIYLAFHTFYEESYPLNNIQLLMADVNLDGSIDIDDSVIIKSYVEKITGYESLPLYTKETLLIYGDINEDKKLNYLDLQFLSKHLKGVTTIDGSALLQADVYLDNVIDEKDMTLLHGYLTNFEGYDELGTNKYTDFVSATYKGNVFLDSDEEGNAIVDEKDVQAIKEHVNNVTQLTGVNLLEADINLDGEITEIDAILLQLYIDGTEGFENLYAVNLEEVITYGDVNSDGVVNEDDETILGSYLAGSSEVVEAITSLQLLAADVNVDGSINNFDMDILKRHIAGWKGYETLPYTGMN